MFIFCQIYWFLLQSHVVVILCNDKCSSGHKAVHGKSSIVVFLEDYFVQFRSFKLCMMVTPMGLCTFMLPTSFTDFIHGQGYRSKIFHILYDHNLCRALPSQISFGVQSNYQSTVIVRKITLNKSYVVWPNSYLIKLKLSVIVTCCIILL